MGILFGLLSSTGKINKEHSLTLSHGAFCEVAEVGEKAGINMCEFVRITEYKENEDTVIKTDDVEKLYEICSKILQCLQEYKKQGKIFLSHNELIEYENFIKLGTKVSKEDFEGSIGRIIAFIRLCEVALKNNEELIIRP